MKTVGKIIGGIVILVLLLLVVLSITGFEPKDRRPGLWLKGDAPTSQVTDWTFINQVPTVKVQTHTWYLLPHSITTNCVSYNGKFYLTSIYPKGVPYPNGRVWNRDVARDPHVKIKVGNTLYNTRLVLVSDPAEKEGALAAKWTKYPNLRTESGNVYLFLVIQE